jgi:Ran GTPase-activating protein (RanGAP) involved in mRNA processing and transport
LYWHGTQRVVASIPNAPLRILGLRRLHLGPEGAVRLFEKGAPPTLQALDLRDNGLVDADALAIASTERFRALRVLDLRDNAIGGEAAARLREALPRTRIEIDAWPG